VKSRDGETAWQPTLPFREREALTARCWEEALSRHLGRAVTVVYNRARSTPVQVQWRGVLKTRLEVRLHEMFSDAPEDVVEALASWIRVGKRARRSSGLLDQWLAHRTAKLPPRAPRKVKVTTRGLCHDLAGLADTLLHDEFAGGFPAERPRPAITWGRRSRSHSRHSIQLGSFDPELRLVRIHPVLDREAVPSWYVRYILFHELLHAALPPERRQPERCIHHGAEFRRRERAYADYGKALRWEKENLSRLIRLARKKPRAGSPPRAEISESEGAGARRR
jgi:hypothetical protein